MENRENRDQAQETTTTTIVSQQNINEQHSRLSAEELAQAVRASHQSHLQELRLLSIVEGLRNLEGQETRGQEGFFYCYNCEPAIAEVLPRIATGEDAALIATTRDQHYCILTTEEQYTLAGKIWSVAFLKAVLSNKRHVVTQLVNLNTAIEAETVTLFSPLVKVARGVEKIVKCTYSEQSLLRMALLISAELDHREIFELLLNREVRLNTPIQTVKWSSNARASMTAPVNIGSLLLQKAIEKENSEILDRLLVKDLELLSYPTEDLSISCLQFIMVNNKLHCLNALRDTTRQNAREHIQRVLSAPSPTQGGGSEGTNFTQEQREVLQNWLQERAQSPNGANAGSAQPSYFMARLTYIIFTSLSFVAAIAFSGIGLPYMREQLMSVGIPTGFVPTAGISLLGISIGAILADHFTGRINRQTTVSFIISALTGGIGKFFEVPTPGGGDRLKDSLATTSPLNAASMFATAFAAWAIVGGGLAAIRWLPEVMPAIAPIPTTSLVAIVGISISVLNALLIPPLYDSLYQWFTTPSKER